MSKKVVAVTFDGAPNAPGTLNMLEVLERHGVKGSFFMEGHRLEKDPETALKVKEAGHDIGNHSYSHPMLDQIPLEEAREEILKTDKLLKDLIGVDTKLVRPPAGQINHDLAAMLLEMGYHIVIWSYNIPVYDWAGPNAEAIAERVITIMNEGENIITFHDKYPYNPDALDIIIPKLKEMGYTFKRVSELTRKGIIQ